MMAERYVAAERLAWALVIKPDADQASATMEWLADFRRVFAREPSDAERSAAESVIAERLADAVPPLPSSASASSWIIPPKLEVGLPKRRS